MKINKVKFAELVLKKLVDKKHNQKWLAEQTGICQQNLSLIMNAKQCPSMSAFIKLAKALKIKLNDVLDCFD